MIILIFPSIFFSWTIPLSAIISTYPFHSTQVISNQSRSCTAWNISLHEFTPIEDEKQPGYAGALIHQFCPRDKHKQFTLPWNLKTVVLKIQAMTRQAPLYSVRWKSQVARQKIQSLTPAPNVISSHGCTFSILSSSSSYFQFMTLLILSILLSIS